MSSSSPPSKRLSRRLRELLGAKTIGVDMARGFGGDRQGRKRGKERQQTSYGKLHGLSGRSADSERRPASDEATEA
jgi:hypothetical protein